MTSTANGLPGEVRRGSAGRVRPLVAWGATAVAAFIVLAMLTARRDAAYVAATTVSFTASASAPVAKSDARRQIVSDLKAVFTTEIPASPSDVARDRFAKDTPVEIVEAAWSTTTSPAFHVKASGGSCDELLEWLNRRAAEFARARNDEVAGSITNQLEAAQAKTRSAWHEREAVARELKALEASAAQQATLPTVSGESANKVAREPSGIVSPANNLPAALIANPAWTAANAEVLRLETEVAAMNQRWTAEHPELKHATLLLAEAKKKLTETPALVADAAEVNAATPNLAAGDPSPSIAPPAESPAINPAETNTNDNVQSGDAAAALATKLQTKRAELSEANRTLDEALAREGDLSRMQTDLAANLPWRIEPALSAKAVPSGATHGPWLLLLPVSIVIGGAVAWLANGLRPMIDSRDDAEALGVPVIGMIPGDGSVMPTAEDPGYVAARWMTRGAVAIVALVAVAAFFALASDANAAARLSDDPLSLFAIPREMLGRGA